MGLLCFSPSLIERLNNSQGRLPPTYIGVRPIREGIEPKSNKTAEKSLENELSEPSKDSGNDDEDVVLSVSFPLKRSADDDDVNEDFLVTDPTTSGKQNDEETDARGDRHFPPVVLPPSLARIALQTNLLTSCVQKTTSTDIEKHSAETKVGATNHDSNLETATKTISVTLERPMQRKVVVDDSLAETWAAQLKDHMKPAETTREQEDLRPMPYTLLPTVWNRHRPQTLGINSDNQIANTKTESSTNESANLSERDPAWAYCHICPGGIDNQPWESDATMVAHILYHGTDLHLSCGAKFGSDLLLYERPRDECHSFAGLRIVHSQSEEQLHLPSPYDLSGYVRGLNTAGKLAMLATVIHDESQSRVAIVDLVLHKVMQTTFRRDAQKTKTEK